MTWTVWIQLVAGKAEVRDDRYSPLRSFSPARRASSGSPLMPPGERTRRSIAFVPRAYGHLPLLEETRTNEIWETSFASDPICRSGKANRTHAAVSLSSHIEFNRLLTVGRRKSSQPPLHTFPSTRLRHFRRIHPGDLQSDCRTYTYSNAQNAPILDAKLVRSVVLPPLSISSNQPHPLRTPTNTGPARDHIISQLDKPRLPGVRPYPRPSPPGSILELTSCDPPHSHQPIVKPGHRQPFRSHIPLPCSV